MQTILVLSSLIPIPDALVKASTSGKQEMSDSILGEVTERSSAAARAVTSVFLASLVKRGS